MVLARTHALSKRPGVSSGPHKSRLCIIRQRNKSLLHAHVIALAHGCFRPIHEQRHAGCRAGASQSSGQMMPAPCVWMPVRNLPEVINVGIHIRSTYCRGKTARPFCLRTLTRPAFSSLHLYTSTCPLHKLHESVQEWTKSDEFDRHLKPWPSDVNPKFYRQLAFAAGPKPGAIRIRPQP